MHATSLAFGPNRNIPVFGRIKPRYTRVRVLCMTFNCFLSFFSPSEILHSSTLCPPYECRRTGRPLPQTLNTPHHAIRATYASAYTPPPIYVHTRYDIRIPICTMATDGSACVCCIRNRGRLDLSYDAGAACGGRDAGRSCVCSSCGVVWDVEGGGGLPARRHSYRGYRVELWRISDGLKNDKKTVESLAE